MANSAAAAGIRRENRPEPKRGGAIEASINPSAIPVRSFHDCAEAATRNQQAGSDRARIHDVAAPVPQDRRVCYLLDRYLSEAAVLLRHTQADLHMPPRRTQDRRTAAAIKFRQIA